MSACDFVCAFMCDGGFILHSKCPFKWRYEAGLNSISNSIYDSFNRN